MAYNIQNVSGELWSKAVIHSEKCKIRTKFAEILKLLQSKFV